MWAIWLFILVVCVVTELSTVGLTAIWFAGGAVAAIIAYACGGNWTLQLILFLAVSFVLLIFTRPFAIKYINNRKKFKSNYEGNIGKHVRVTVEVNNRNDTGSAMLDGMEWMARARLDSDIFPANSDAKVVDIQGVKLILEKL